MKTRSIRLPNSGWKSAVLSIIILALSGAGAGLTWAQTSFGATAQKEVRKAIPVASSGVKNAKGGAGQSGDYSLNETAKRPVSREGVDTPADTHAGPGGDDPGARAPQFGVNTMRALNDKRPIGIRDRLSLTIVEDELPQRPIVVTDAGEIDVPYIGRVSVEGRTCKGLAMHLKSLLEKEYYHQATVLIGLDAAGGQIMSKGRYYLDGQVNRPGPYEIPIDEALTVSKAIIRGGGFTQYANRKKVRLMRKNPKSGSTEIFISDMISVMERGQSRGDMEVLPEDTIFVDEKFFNF
jgi:polysaccharide biosynthesis/export protein